MVIECAAVKSSLTSILVASLFSLSACGGGDDAADDGGGEADAAPADAGGGSEADAAPAGEDAASGEDLDMQAADFKCILDGTKVRQFFVVNPLGHLDEALEVASSKKGGTYPVGTILQLIPQEAMVKRRAGWNPATGDWEFFSLSVLATETVIDARGGEEVVNAFGGNCYECHSKAEAQWDLVCEDTHGCDPLSIGDDIIESLQNGDTRCL